MKGNGVRAEDHNSVLYTRNVDPNVEVQKDLNKSETSGRVDLKGFEILDQKQVAEVGSIINLINITKI